MQRKSFWSERRTTLWCVKKCPTASVHAKEQSYPLLTSLYRTAQLSRRREYEENGRGINWKFRGVGYLYTKLQMVLAARVFILSENGVDRSTHSVHIFNVYSPRREHARLYDTTSFRSKEDGEHGVDGRRNDCHKLTIWTRGFGPEIFAGSAKAVPATESADCYWAFDFAVRITYPRFVVLSLSSKMRSQSNREWVLPAPANTALGNGSRDVHAGYQGSHLERKGEAI